MSTTLPHTKIALFDIDYTLFDTHVYKASELTNFTIYEEVIAVLKEVSEFATVGVFSEGELEHQLKKLIKTEIRDFFEESNLHIFSKKLDSLPQVLSHYKGQQLFFIDDKLIILQAIKQADPSITTIWVKRGFYAEQTPEIPGFKPDEEAIDLKRIGEIIHNT